MERRNLAFYKKSGTPWNDEEIINIYRYVGDPDESAVPDGTYDHDFYTRTWIYDDGETSPGDTVGLFYYMWEDQEEDKNFPNCRQVAYESMLSPIRRRKK